ncbi:hypothetical protein [Alkalicoccus halolimnae]|uniref:Uncharacterized protein n=1 Tax=Alkalicoccus halolimnae TaxID=1667239 RepID=A0A5C7F251_9BACI|nr:hypothetical protein [Alkalicoccus halolimnae]TXF83949.1 hypothetical protein FTX54_11705 [Alkalicoccus halolimnae]
MAFFGNGSPIYTGGINDIQKRSSLLKIDLLFCLFYRKLQWTWGGSGAMKDEPKIHSVRPQGGRD